MHAEYHGLICDTSVKHVPQHDQLPLHPYIFFNMARVNAL